MILVFLRKRTRPLMAVEPVDTSRAAANVLLSPLQPGEANRTTQAGTTSGAAQPTAVELDTKTLEQIAALAWRVLRRLGVTEHAVADAVQDALVVVHRRLPEFRGDSKFSTWVYGILLRVASDHRRGQRRASRVFVPTNTPEQPDFACSAPTPLEHLEQQEGARLLKDLLERLPEGTREVFVLVELEELNFGTVASILRISESTVKSRLRSARQSFDIALKRELARRGSGASP